MYKPSLKTKYNGVPILSKLEIDEIAEHLIADFCPEALQNPMEIDIDAFVLNYLGLKQDFQYLSHCGVYLGMMVFNDTDKVIVYNPEISEAIYIDAKEGTVIIDNSLLLNGQEHRYRFTVGHEGGHWITHRPVFQSKQQKNNEVIIQCRAITLDENIKPVSLWTDKDSMEWQANYMSSALLMPKSMVFKLIAGLPTLLGTYKNFYFVDAVSKKFNVSWKAAECRLRGFGIIKEGPLIVSLDIECDR